MALRDQSDRIQSGDATIAARFRDDGTATRVAASLRELARAHEAFLSSPEGERWRAEHGARRVPTPPLVQYGAAHGVDWSAPGEGLSWEEDGRGAPVLTVGAVGDAVVVYHPYCDGLPQRTFRALFAALGASAFGAWAGDRPRVIATATGHDARAERELALYLARVREADHPGDVEEPPPWGERCDDPRAQDDEDRDARLEQGSPTFERTPRGVRLGLAFANTYAGALAIASWLRSRGYGDVEVKVEDTGGAIEGADAEAAAREPVSGLFGDVRPLRERLAGADERIVVASLFHAGHMSDPFRDAFAGLAHERIAELAIAEARGCWDRGLDVTLLCVAILEELAPSAARERLARALWDHLVARWERSCGDAVRGLALALPADEAYERAAAWYAAAGDRETQRARLAALASLGDPRVLDLLEAFLEGSAGRSAVREELAVIAASSRLSWPRAVAWLERGRPWSLVAIDALVAYAGEGAPRGFHPPPLDELRDVLNGYLERDGAPHVSKGIAVVLRASHVLAASDPDVSDAPRSKR